MPKTKSSAAVACEPTELLRAFEKVHTTDYDAVVEAMCELPDLAYQTVRKAQANELGIPVSALDKAVRAAKRNSSIIDADAPFEDVEPSTEAADLCDVLEELTALIPRLIICDPHITYIAALWVIQSYLPDVFDIASILVITSPEPRCGKSEFRRLLGKLVFRAVEADNVTAAIIFRLYEQWGDLTLLVDECDCMNFKENEEMRSVFNSGHQRGGRAFRNEKTASGNFVVRAYPTFGLKVAAGIGLGWLPATMRDRAIIARLRRKLQNEAIVRQREIPKEYFHALRSKLLRAAQDNAEAIGSACPAMPEPLNDRQADNFGPLFQIAQVAGGDWPTRIWDAALKLSSETEEGKTISTELLVDISEIFATGKVTYMGKPRDRIFTCELVRLLCDDPEKRWATFNRGFPITPVQIATLLREFGIYSNTVRIGGAVAKGYELKHFQDAFERYLPVTGQDVTATQEGPVTSKNKARRGSQDQCNVVTAKTSPTKTKSNSTPKSKGASLTGKKY